MTISIAPSVAAGSSTEPQEAVINSDSGPSSKQNPPIVSPTPTEPLEGSKSKQMQINSTGDAKGDHQEMTPTVVRTNSNAVKSPVATPVANSNIPPKKKPEKDSSPSSSSAKHPPSSQPKKDLSLSSSPTSRYPQETTTSSTKSYKAKHSTKKDSSSSSSSTPHRSAHPPLISRYCGCCGDRLTLKAYGIDKEGKDRYTLFHQHERIYLTIDEQQFQEAAEAIQQNTKPKKTSKSTKASRKKKKLFSSRSNGSAQWHYHHNLELNRNHHQNEFLKNLPPWPQESANMDRTILEGLMALKYSPMEEVACSCWNNLDSNMNPATGKSISPKTKKLKAGAKLTPGKTKVALKKKSALAKGATSLTGSPAITEVISTKTIITKCPKTGKKIKKIVRTVKKLKKKLVKKLVAVPGATGASPKSSPTVTGVAKQKAPSTLIPSFSSLATPSKDTPKQQGSAGKSKKRGHDDEASGSSDDDESVALKKRRRNDEKADLDLRERLMNCPLENGPLFPSQQELMELTTIRKRNALQTFYKRFNELRQFIAIFGDANVPQQFPENHSLGIWVNKMRMERKKWDTGSERTSLTERKIELLESIDFIWAQNHKGEIGWERRFHEIKKFKRKHGHCNVPTKSAENRALGRWVSTQRTMYKNYMKGFVGKSLTREEQERRIVLLDKEGFLFSMIPNGQSPNEKGEQQQRQQQPQQGGNNLASLSVNLASAAIDPSQTGNGTSALAASTTDTASTPTTPKPTNAAPNSALKTPPTTTEDTSKIPPSSSVKTKNGEEKSFEAPVSDDKRATATSSPPPAPTSSIAQISDISTPATTPSVSTTASPDRSPRQKMEDEPDSIDDNIAMSDQMGKMRNENDERGSEMPVVPSLVKSVSKNEEQTTKSLTMSGALPGNGNMGSSQMEAAKEEARQPSPPGTPPTRSLKSENDRTIPDRPQLITSDGMRIIVRMADGEDVAEASLSSSVLSPSRRSIRARKPSARQLEAEKSPLRESILGR